MPVKNMRIGVDTTTTTDRTAQSNKTSRARFTFSVMQPATSSWAKPENSSLGSSRVGRQSTRTSPPKAALASSTSRRSASGSAICRHGVSVRTEEHQGKLVRAQSDSMAVGGPEYPRMNPSRRRACPEFSKATRPNSVAQNWLRKVRNQGAAETRSMTAPPIHTDACVAKRQSRRTGVLQDPHQVMLRECIEMMQGTGKSTHRCGHGA